MANGKSKKPVQQKSEKQHRGMKVVTSGVCEACKTPCSLGISYAARMRVPGAIGKGVPCILTKKE
ncbi:hypothetical protein [Paenibacillus pini]|uniref:Uncharacterized protein n=1 Tax=Paenibacillus pini JCM 16418 TaxID=1236976 RepID=W7YRE0_9BACL|nr:hypothetical protein [Paenibacillus pini]GAF07136.1 hypothetical protein JCM16418_1127 [Paenibacillus pini JCM 16418]